MFLCRIDSMAQAIRYTYDDTGNRILRTIVLSSAREASSVADTIPDVIADTKFLIYPNPTRGSIQIEIDNASSSQPSQMMVSVYSTSGVILQKMALTNNSSKIDLSKQPNGVYLLKIEGNKESTSYRIIKE